MFNSLVMPAAMILAAPAVSAAADAPALPAWMEGCWVEVRSTDWTEECWMAPRSGMMLGASRNGTAERITNWEFLRIEANAETGEGQSGGMVYRASPQGRAWVPFALSPSADGSVTFVNAANDYPQRIRYWREGMALKAEIAMKDGSQAREWTFRPGRMP